MSLKLPQISGYVNHLGELRTSENGTQYRNILLGRGADKPAMSITLFNTQARLAEFELVKGAKVKLTRVKLSPNTTTKGYIDNKIANVFSVIALDWEVVSEWSKDQRDVEVENGSSFQGFANHVKENTTPSGKPNVSVLLGRGQNKPSVNFNAYGDKVAELNIQKGQFIAATRLNLSVYKTADFTKNNIATDFYLNVLDIQVRGEDNASTAAKPEARTRTYTRENAPNKAQDSRQSKPPVDADESYANHIADRQTENAGGYGSDDIPF